MSTARRVAITGLGVVSSIGLNRQEFWSSLCAGRSGIQLIQGVDRAQLTMEFGAEIRDFDPAERLEAKQLRGLDRFAALTLVAAQEAIRDSGLDWDDALRERTGVVTGTSMGGAQSQEVAYERIYAQGRMRLPPQVIPSIMCNAGASQISMACGFRGPAFTLSTACSSSNHAIGNALWLIRNGQAEVALAGGSESMFTLALLKAWDGLRVVAPTACRPFTKSLPGMTIGEGGAMLVLEPLDAARKRGARIYAELAGFGMSADAHTITAPSLEGPVAAIRAALSDAQMAPEDVDYISAHGTGTAANDPNEVRAIQEVFGSHASKLSVSSTKSMHGHALGGAGALEAVVSAMAVHSGVVPPTANHDETHPDCDLDIVPNEAKEREVRGVISNSFAFGGLNAILAFRAVDGGRG